jgi:hypothetical protein
LEDGNLYLRLRTMSHTIYAAKFEQTIIHQHVLLRRESQPHILYNGKVSRIDRASVTIILCLHVLIARRILLILDMLIIFSEYRCLKQYVDSQCR